VYRYREEPIDSAHLATEILAASRSEAAGFWRKEGSFGEIGMGASRDGCTLSVSRARFARKESSGSAGLFAPWAVEAAKDILLC